MPLATGTRLGPYEIEDAIGAGGMGEVYKARDTRLDRSVAIKVLAPAIADDPTLRARFEREARAVAALDHPHICGIYDVGNDDGRHFFVMPHLEGETLASRLEKGPLPLPHALTIAGEIADALDKAHRHGIVHRDLKPANVMLTKAGAKLLDFGLAKLKAPAGPISMSGMTRMATTSPGTGQGTILGTVHYMAPEQVEGKDADARSDIWALGAVLYEMVTGTRPFAGDTAASVIGSVLKDEPQPVSARLPLVPRALDHLVQGCLAKDPDMRWQSSADVRREMEWIGHTLRDPVEPSESIRRPRRRVMQLAALAAISTAMFATGALTGWRFMASAAISQDTIRFAVFPPADVALSPSPVAAAAQLAVSPDGKRLAFTAARRRGVSQIWVHTFQLGQAQLLPGTEGASFPFWSPDSRSLGFFAEGKLKRIDLDAGSPQPLATAANGRGGTWSPGGDILFTPSPNGAIYRVSSSGGEVTQETVLDEAQGAITHYWPQFLPDGRRVLYYQRSRTPEHQGIYVKSLGANDAKRVLNTNGMALFSADRLLYMRDTMLFAVDFDQQALEPRGEPVRVAENVGHFGGTLGYVAITASATGVLAHGPSVVTRTALQWRNRAGDTSSTVSAPGVYRSPRLSPDQTSVAVAMLGDTQSPDIYVLELTRGGRSRITADPRNDWYPVWSHDGRRLFFSSTRVGSSQLYQKEPSATGDGDPVMPTTFTPMYATDVSADGKRVIHHLATPGAGYDLGVVELGTPPRTVPFLATPFNEIQARFSPNGKWVAYASDESGKFEVYVRPFPVAPGKFPISSGGGVQPEWRRDGKELFFVSGDGHLMAVGVTTDGSFAAREPKELFAVDIPEHVDPYPNDYAAGVGGQRFLVNTIVDQPIKPALTVILNWAAGLPGR